MARVLAISSHVARGCVGLTATVPALQFLGHEVWGLPTVLLSTRPGLGQLVKHELPPSALAGMLSALESDGCWGSVDAVLTGYFPSAQAVGAAARAISSVKRANAKTLVLVDPILGDAGRLYIGRETAEAIRDQLLPLASIATPNLFELQWLTDTSAATREEIAGAARKLGPPVSVVTSALETAESVTTLLVAADKLFGPSAPLRSRIPNGAGDLLAGLLLGYLLEGHSCEPALDAALQDLDRVLEASEGRPQLRLCALRAEIR